MLSGEFERKLRKLNSRLRIYCSNDNSKPAGLFQVVNGEYIEICGVDKNFIPKLTVWDNQGHIVKSGWFRILKLLFSKNLINKNKAESLFSFHFDNYNNTFQIESKPLDKKIEQAKQSGKWHKDDLAEIGSAIK